MSTTCCEPCVLSDLTLHQEALIQEMSSSEHDLSELQELGFVPGTFLKLVGRLPFGGPLAFELRGTVIALRREDAERIIVQPA